MRGHVEGVDRVLPLARERGAGVVGQTWAHYHDGESFRSSANSYNSIVIIINNLIVYSVILNSNNTFITTDNEIFNGH